MQCLICSQVIEGKTSAKLINHIKNKHQLTLEEYVIRTELGGMPPKCACNLCEEKPVFHRGKFLTYAMGHDSFSKREVKYKQKHGEPTCLVCGNVVSFYRGEPKSFCSARCAGKYNGGFVQSETQNKIKTIVNNKYGVDNVSKIETVRERASERQTGRNNSFYGQKHSEETLQQMSSQAKKMWLSSEYRSKVIPKFSELRKRNWQDPVYRKTILEGNLSGKHSKLHQKISSYLGLKELGFESEKVIFRYRVDEINFEKKIIVEMNGDYIHANPNKFKADDLIIVRKSQYLAKDKWLYDQKRREALEALGFKIFVVWQSDDWDEKRKELLEVINENSCSL